MQLVGLACVRCRNSIGSVIDGQFCAGCGCPVHNECAAPRATVDGECRLCGAGVDAIRSHSDRSAAAAAGTASDLWPYHLTWALANLVGGLALLAWGAINVLGLIMAPERGSTFNVVSCAALIVAFAPLRRSVRHIRALRALR